MLDLPLGRNGWRRSSVNPGDSPPKDRGNSPLETVPEEEASAPSEKPPGDKPPFERPAYNKQISFERPPYNKQTSFEKPPYTKQTSFELPQNIKQTGIEKPPAENSRFEKPAYGKQNSFEKPILEKQISGSIDPPSKKDPSVRSLEKQRSLFGFKYYPPFYLLSSLFLHLIQVICEVFFASAHFNDIVAGI